MTLPSKTKVLIIGGGPVGLTTASLLSQNGIDCVVVEKREEPQRAPAAHVLRRRSMEVFDRLGVTEEIHRRMPRVPIHFITWCSTLGGVEAGRLDFRTTDGNGLENGIWTNCPQNILEPILHEHVATLPNAVVYMGTECLGFEQSADRVDAHLRSTDGTETTIAASWVIACDGASSDTRHALDIPMLGQGALGNFFMMHFEADLRRWISHRPGPLFWFLSPETPGTLIVHDPVKSHVLMTPVTGVPDEEATLEARLRAALSVPVEPKILDVKTWAPHVQVAEHYRSGRIFLAGDAAHRFPPSGGLGLNTGILDADNLVRKLVRVERGEAEASLLDRYETECRPAAVANANSSFENLLRLGEVWAAIGQCADLAALETRLTTMSAEEKRALADAIEAQRSHFVSDGHFPEEPATESMKRSASDAG